jgi:hypothetical protein
VILATGKGAYTTTTTLRFAERMWIHTDTPRVEAVIGTTSPGLKGGWAGWGSDLPSGNVLARFQQDGTRVEDIRFRGNGTHPYDCGAPTSPAGWWLSRATSECWRAGVAGTTARWPGSDG